MNQTEVDPHAGAFARLLVLVAGFALMGLSVTVVPDGMPIALIGYGLYLWSSDQIGPTRHLNSGS